MKHLIIIFTLIFLTSATGFSQTLAHVQVIDGDTIPVITMGEVTVFDEMGETGKDRYREYWKLVHNVKKVMPYALTFAQEMHRLDSTLSTIQNKRKRKQYLKVEEERLKERFENRLKNLTFSQGEVLIKLIDRETGKSSYDLIKDYKSGFTALWWNSFASVFGMNLKNKYDPEQEQAIETVLHALGYE